MTIKITHTIKINETPAPGRHGCALISHIEGLVDDIEAAYDFLNGMTIHELADCLEWAETVYHPHAIVRGYVQQKLIQMDSDIKKLKNKVRG